MIWYMLWKSFCIGFISYLSPHMFYLCIFWYEHLLSPLLGNFDYTRQCSQLVTTSDFQTYSLMAESFCPFATSVCSSWSLSRVQLCATPWSLPGSSIHGIFQARILEWVAIFFLQGNLPDPGVKPMSPLSPSLWADSLLFNLRICGNWNSFLSFFNVS